MKQSPRTWFRRFPSILKAFNYNQSNLDHTFIIKHKVGKITILIVYVNNMIFDRR